mgnify:CR=1 FL=1
MKVPKFILPSTVKLKGNSCTYQTGSVLINALTCQLSSRCPLCNKRSNRIHSRYFRELADLPVSGNLVRIKLVSRKYFCDNTTCSRKIFTERFSEEITPYGRRMSRSVELISKIALELGGNKGAGISKFAGVPVSSSTIVRIIKKLPNKEQTITSGIIGIDDWAFKKGRTYGTIVVDLDSNQVIDLLPDREAGTVSDWIKKHPEIQVISRDRYRTYAIGATNGAPQAIQVADRFHLMKNLGEATSRMFQTKSKVLREVFDLYNDNQTQKESVKQTQVSETIHGDDDKSTRINPAKSYKFNKVKELQQQGFSKRAIADALKISRKTVARYFSLDALYIRKGHSRTNFDSFTPILMQEDSKSKTYKELFQTIKKDGFSGKYTSFCERMNNLYASNKITRAGISPKTDQIRAWSPNQLSFLLYSDKEKLSIENNRFLDLLFNTCPEIKQIGVLVKQFKELFKRKEPDSLSKWIANAQMVDNLPFKNFAKNLLRDYDAVNNAVVTPYSNGQVEGQVNRLKNIKRMMYGRASFQLLRKMVLSKSILFHQN